jgi:hypothetical protein
MNVARIATVAALLAIGFALSPLTMIVGLGIVPVVMLGRRGLEADERRWFTTILILAIALRVAAVVVLFLATDHARVPFGTLFGDEEYFIKRSLWLRNVALGLPVHPFDLEYAFEPNVRSSFLYLLAFIQTITGPAPYALHLVCVLCYVAAVVILYHSVRNALGRVPALSGFAVLMFLPSLFAWSVAVLKESVFVLISAVIIVLASAAARPLPWRKRASAAAAATLLMMMQGTIRDGGGAFALAAVVMGLTLAFVVKRPRLLLATVVSLPILFAVVVRIPEVQLRAYAAIQRAARQHWGAVAVSQGRGYQLLDQRFYRDTNEISSLEFAETARYLVRSATSFVVVPLPWDGQSAMAAGYIPEQIVWYVLALLVPIGVFYSFQRDAVLTGLLIAHAGVVAAASALTDGNVGTLVRHRGLALPYLVWLSAMGGCGLLLAVARRTAAPEARVL